MQEYYSDNFCTLWLGDCRKTVLRNRLVIAGREAGRTAFHWHRDWPRTSTIQRKVKPW